MSMSKMTYEIKEILAYFEEYVKITDMHDSEPMLNWKDLKIVLDYITNLQEKLNRIDKLINTYYGCVSYYYKYNNKYLKSEIKEDINNILKGDKND